MKTLFDKPCLKNMELRDRFILMNAAFDQKSFKVDKELKII